VSCDRHWVLEEEPDKVQLHFCIGVLNFFGKEDHVRALQAFERFLEITPSTDFVEQKRLTKAYIQNIHEKLSTIDPAPSG